MSIVTGPSGGNGSAGSDNCRASTSGASWLILTVNAVPPSPQRAGWPVEFVVQVEPRPAENPLAVIVAFAPSPSGRASTETRQVEIRSTAPDRPTAHRETGFRPAFPAPSSTRPDPSSARTFRLQIAAGLAEQIVELAGTLDPSPRRNRQDSAARPRRRPCSTRNCMSTSPASSPSARSNAVLRVRLRSWPAQARTCLLAGQCLHGAQVLQVDLLAFEHGDQ